MAPITATSLVLKAFRIRKGEFEKTFLMFLFAFNWVAAFLVGRVMKDTLFLSKTDLTWLPYMYLIVAAVVPASLVFSRIIGQRSLWTIGNITLTTIFLGLMTFRLLLAVADPFWVVPALYVFIEIMGVMLMIIFWSFANELFNSREAKRLFGVIAAGLVLANLLGFPLRAIKDYIGINNLAYICAVSVLICMFIFNYLSSRYRLVTLQRGRARTRTEHSSSVQMARSGVFASLRKHIILLTGVTMFTVTLVDYQFKLMASQHHANDMASFFFTIYAYTGVFSCIIQFFLTGRLLEKFGILTALMILPLSLLGGSFMTLAVLGYAGITLTKGGELVTRYTITETATQLFYQPLPPALRRQTKTLSDGVMRPAVMALAGIIFIIFNHFLPVYQSAHLEIWSWGIMICVIGWLVLLYSTRQRYVEALLISGDRRARVTGSELEEDDRTLAVSRLVIQRTLAGDDESQILNALEVLPLTRLTEWDEHVLPLLSSGHPVVREKAIEYLGRSGNRKYSRRIAELFSDREELVRAAAIKTYSALEHERAVPQISRFLNQSSPLVKAATITGLKKMLENPDPRERESGARVLGYIQIKSFFQPLFLLIHDRDLNVRLAAIESAGQMRSPELSPNLIYLLQYPETHATASRALAAYGEDLLPQLEEVLGQHHLSPRIRQSIPVILGQIESPASYDILEPLLETRDARLRSAVMRAMQKLFTRMETLISPDISRIQRALHAELQNYYQQLVHIERLTAYTKNAELLISSLHDRLTETIDRVFHLLGIIYPRDQIDVVYYNLRSENAAMRANGIEIVDNICENETRRYLLPLLDTLPLDEKVAAGRHLFQLQDLEPNELLRNFMWHSGDDWLAACTITAIGAEAIYALKDDIISFADHENPVVREAVVFAMHKLVDSRDFVQFSGQYLSERDEVVRGYLNHLIESSEVHTGGH
jgi:ATP/ADP translocase/HEAT repeat protein